MFAKLVRAIHRVCRDGRTVTRDGLENLVLKQRNILL